MAVKVGHGRMERKRLWWLRQGNREGVRKQRQLCLHCEVDAAAADDAAAAAIRTMIDA